MSRSIWLVLVLFLGLAQGCSCGAAAGSAGDGGPGGTGTGGGSDGGGPGAGGGCIDGLKTIALAPAASTVTLDGTSPAPSVTFTATGTFTDGHTAALDAGHLTWTVTRDDDTPPGTIAAGVLDPYPSAGGEVTVLASDGCASGKTTVTFVLETTVGTPANPGAWSGTPDTTGTVPAIVYPSDQTRFPRNIYRQLFQWRSQGYTDFRLTFTGPGATVTVYTDGVNPDCNRATPAAGCFELDQQTWTYVAGSNAGHTVTFTVDALDTSTSPPTIRRSAPVTLGFSRRDVKGAIFYWSTTSAGVRRADIGDAAPEDYITGKPGTVYPSDGDKVKCVACHTVSRDGLYMAAPVQSAQTNSVWVMKVTATAPPPPLVKSIANTGGHGFVTFSPDDQYLAADWKGALWTVARATGDKVEDVPLGGLKATEPDWSPDGSLIAFATGNGDAPGGASIAVVPYHGVGSWGTPKVLVEPPQGLSDLFPMFSPDGQWIAYAQGKGGHDDLTAQLFVVDAAGAAPPVELVNANRVVSNAMTDGQHQNSEPTWAPPGDLDWIAFNSMRAYGVVRPAGTQQIWVAAVDPAKLGTGQDPSFPAFRVPFQGLDENDHRAFWTLDVRQGPPDNGGGGGGADGGTTDGGTSDGGPLLPP